MGSLSLARLVQATESELQQAPDVRLWRTRIRQTISDVYMDLWQSRPWPFRIREAPLWVYPDFTLTKAQLFIASSTTQRIFGSNGLGTSLAGTMFPAGDATGGVLEDHYEHLVGAEVGIESPSTSDKSTGNWLEGPFVIEKIKNGAIYAKQIWLDPRCNVSAVDTSTSGGSFKVRFPRYILPHDCDQLLKDGIKDDDGQSLPYIDHQRFRWLEQGTARPPRSGGALSSAWTYDEGFDVTAPLHHYVSPNLWSTDTVAPVFFDHHKNVPVRETIAAAVSAGSSSFITGQRYRFAVSWFYAGRFGPLSNVVEATPTSANPRVTLSELPEVPYLLAIAPETTYGWVLAIWIAIGDGPFYLLSVLDPPPSTGASGVSTTQVLQAPYASTQLHHKRLRHSIFSPDVYRYIRVYPRPTEHKKYQMRYLRRALPLEAEEDVPEFHEAFHMALVYGAAARLTAIREGSSSRSSLFLRMSQMFERKTAELTQFYFPGQHEQARKGSILAPVPDRWRIDGVDYNGDS